MQISLSKLIPTPLKDRLLKRSSDIWNSDIVLKEQEWIKVKAPSGTGKTTLIHFIYQLRKDYEGEIGFDHIPTDKLSAEKLAQIRQTQISIIFQDLRLFTQLSCRENIELKRIMQDPYYTEKRIDEMAGTLGVAHILDQKAGICSYGEQQRIAIIRALIQPFNWLIMDEPFSHLDQANTIKAADLITTECKKRNAGLLITDLEEDTYFNYTKRLAL